MNPLVMWTLGAALSILAAFLGIMSLVSFVIGDAGQAGAFLLTAIITGFVGGGLVLAFHGVDQRMRRADIVSLMQGIS